MPTNNKEVLLDVSRLIGRLGEGRLPTGVDRVGLAYVRHFGGHARAVIQRGRFRRIASVRTSQRAFELLREPDASFGRKMRSVIADALLSKWPSQDGNCRLYLNVGHTGLDEPGYASWLRRARLRSVSMVHDLIPLTHPEYCRAGERERHLVRMRSILATDVGIIANSRHTLDQLDEFAGLQGLAMPPAVVAPLATGRLQLASNQDSPLSRPYFVMVGTIEPRKNHLTLLHLWRDLILQLGDGAPVLVLIGQRGWECENIADLLDRSDILRSNVVELENCQDAELFAWLHHARALLFPSFAEGYGLPLVEALAAGLPAIASNLRVFRENAGDVPDYLDPIDGLGWRQAVLDYLPMDSPRRMAQMERLSEWSAPSWQRHFEHVDALLERLG